MASPFARPTYTSIFVKVSPPPITFAERRSVLRALQQHGKITMFKKLEDDTSFISMTPSADTAKALLSSSPITYIFTDLSGHASQPFASSKLPTPPVQPPNTSLYTTLPIANGSSFSMSPASRAQGRQFRLTLHPVPRSHSHARSVRDNPLYGPWPAHVTATETQISRALAASIPLGDDVGMARDGLRFWPTASEVVWDEAEGGEGGKGGKGEDAGGVGAGGRLSGREFALSRKRRRELREALPRVMTFGVMRREGGEREVDDDDLEAADVLEESASAVVQEEDCLAEPQARQDSPER